MAEWYEKYKEEYRQEPVLEKWEERNLESAYQDRAEGYNLCSVWGCYRPATGVDEHGRRVCDRTRSASLRELYRAIPERSRDNIVLTDRVTAVKHLIGSFWNIQLDFAPDWITVGFCPDTGKAPALGEYWSVKLRVIETEPGSFRYGTLAWQSHPDGTVWTGRLVCTEKATMGVPVKE